MNLSERELETLLISAVRYALGRSTYIVKDTVDLVLYMLPELDVHIVSILHRDVSRELSHAINSNSLVGMAIDHAEWQRLEIELKKRYDQLVLLGVW